MKNTSRRDFIKTSGAVSSFFILPSGLRANSPNGKICTAHIGTGGKGRVDTAYLAKHKLTRGARVMRRRLQAWEDRHLVETIQKRHGFSRLP